MAGFKKQIAEKFKAKFPKVNLTKVRLNAIIDKLDLKIEDEETIDEKLDELNDVVSFEDIAKQDDKIRDLEAKKAKTKGEEPKEDEDEVTESDDAPAWFKAYQEKTDKLMNAIVGDKVATGRKAQLEAKLKEAPEAFKAMQLKALGRMQFENDDEFSSFLEEVEQDASAFIQSEADKGLGNDKPHLSLQSKGATVKAATQAELDEAAKNLKI